MRKKRGQFYLVAAILIISILAGFVAVTNYTKTPSTIDLTEIKGELDIEIGNFLDYVISNDLSAVNSNEKFTNFSSIYVEKIGDKKNILFLFGDSSSIKVNGVHSESSENISIDHSGSYILLGETFDETYSLTNTNILIKDGEDVYSFEILEGKNFYYLVSKLEEGEKQVITG